MAWRDDLAAVLGVPVEDEVLFRQALTHASYANEHAAQGAVANERLEFLGDAVLQLVVSDYLFRTYPDLSEGALTRARAAVVSTPTLSRKGGELGLDRFLLLGRGEEASGGRQRASLLENAFEAVTGAIYLEGGLQRARAFVLRWLATEIAAAASGGYGRDWKSELQEWAQARGLVVQYELAAETGPDHARVFQVTVRTSDGRFGYGVGRSKKRAEQLAARDLLERLRQGVPTSAETGR
ncbi:MAG: ribonuclease III [Clostridia bacterium]|nr:ribonuclease III [Clostridia bacterium]